MTGRLADPATDRPEYPALRVLSLGAGVQSSCLLLLAAAGHITPFDVCLFADTGWEPRAVYRQLDRLTVIATAAGMPVQHVSTGNIRTDALDPTHRFASMPLFCLSPDGKPGLARRQCTGEYKLKPLKAEVRHRLGYPYPKRVPTSVWAQMCIGISVDEVQRARDADVRYMRNEFPLLDLGMSRRDCRRFLTSQGFGDLSRSACIGCPFHRNDFWAALQRDSPDEFADAVAFDRAIRHGHPHATRSGHPSRGTFYLHHSRVPLDQADLTTRSHPTDWDEPDGCSPFTCRTTHPAESAAA